MASILKVDEIQDITGKKILQNTGSVLQIVKDHASNAGGYINSTSYTDINLTVSITPTSTASKILVLCTGSFQTDDDNGAIHTVRVLRDDSTTTGITYGGTDEVDNAMTYSYSMMHLDEPATTSSVTYKVQVKSTKVNSDFRARGGGDNLFVLEIAG